MALDELMADVAMLMPGATLVDDLTNSGRAALARISVDGQTYVAKRNIDADRFANEVSALQTLPAEVRPQLVALGARTVIMEDLGVGESLADVLLAGDPARATEALLLWARTLAGALKPSLRQGSREARLDLGDAARDYLVLAEHLGVARSDIDTDVRKLEDALSATTPWFVFGPSDACPDNNRLMADGTMKFFDFEGACWRHAASEAAYTRAPFCTCWCVGALPDGITAAMEDAFMDALEPPDPGAFREATGAAVVAYMLQFAPGFRWQVDEDAPMAPSYVIAPTRGRQYAHGRLAMVATYEGAYPAIAALAAEMAAAMRAKWPDCAPLPLYPAFR
jgi:hypothetical protein